MKRNFRSPPLVIVSAQHDTRFSTFLLGILGDQTHQMVEYEFFVRKSPRTLLKLVWNRRRSPKFVIHRNGGPILDSNFSSKILHILDSAKTAKSAQDIAEFRDTPWNGHQTTPEWPSNLGFRSLTLGGKLTCRNVCVQYYPENHLRSETLW